MIFEMARRSLIIEEKNKKLNVTKDQPERWYPSSGIPISNDGFEKIIWKNARKRSPSLWSYSLRMYERMGKLESEGHYQIQRSNIHHEGALVACSKLADWHKALEIYHDVREIENCCNTKNKPNAKRTEENVFVTDDMIHSVVRAAVRASHLRSRSKNNESTSVASRRIPLDTVLEILSTLPDDQNVYPYFLNPLSAAYQKLGCTDLSKKVLEQRLPERRNGEEDAINVHDLCAKDKGSYSLLVQTSVIDGDWGLAVSSLSQMVDAGIYPNPRHTNTWYESQRSRPRATGSWKKKRNDYWTETIY